MMLTKSSIRPTSAAVGRVCTPASRLSVRMPLPGGTSMIPQAFGTISFRNASPDAAQPPVAAAAPAALPALFTPQGNYDNIVNMGVYKASSPPGKIFLLGIMAGAYVGFGGFIMLSIAGGMPGVAASNPALFKLIYGMIFPVALLMVILSGADLYTGNTAVITCALLEKRITFGQLLKSFFFSYIGNFVGSLIVVALVVGTGMMTGNPMPALAAVAKTSIPFGAAVVRGILANWLVCVAVFHASCSTTLTGKMLGLWIPITAFVAIGLEHSVANMFIIPMGMALGAKISIADYLLKNLLPVTIGNTLAGVFCMAIMYAACFGSLGKSMFSAKKP